jgi:hypothetical protein
MSPRPAKAASIALSLAALMLSGCGSGSATTATNRPETVPATAPVQQPPAPVPQSGGPKPPKGASPALREIYRQFPPPKAGSGATGSAAAIRAGERACANKTPVEVKERYFVAARPHLDPEQAKMIASIGSYESHEAKEYSFTAGQLAADTYEATLPAAVGQFGYQGCIYSLAGQLERRLAPAKE